MNKKIIAGVTLVFVSGMFYTRFIGIFMAIFFEGQIRNEQGILVTPPPMFYENGFIFALYGIPFLISGLYLIKKSYPS